MAYLATTSGRFLRLRASGDRLMYPHGSILRSVLQPSVTYLPVRGKKVVQPNQAKKKMKKDLEKVAMKDYLKEQELDMLMKGSALKAARKGGPLDPEMLNPARKRVLEPVPPEEAEKRYLLVKEWSRYKIQKHKEELLLLQGMLKSRRKALAELKKTSFPLYCQALKLRRDLFPYECNGPTATPPIPDYVPPDVPES